MMTGGSLGSEGTGKRGQAKNQRVENSARGQWGSVPAEGKAREKVKRQMSLNSAVGQESGKDEAGAVKRVNSPDLIKELGCCSGSSEEPLALVVVSIRNS